jgi:acyl carrier protein
MSVQQSDDTRLRLIQILTGPTHMSLQLSTQEIGDETSLTNDLGLDSIQLLEFCTAIEEEFNISVAEAIEHTTWDRFASLVELVRDAREASRPVKVG